MQHSERKLPEYSRPRIRGLMGNWNARLTKGSTAIATSLPAWFSNNAIVTYLIALAIVNVMYFSRGTEWYFILFGLAWVIGFFAYGKKLSKTLSVCAVRTPKRFEKQLFWIAFAIRAIYVVFIYFFYKEMQGIPYEFQSADSRGYMGVAQDFAIYFEQDTLWTILKNTASLVGVSDLGYPLFVFPIFAIFDVDFGLIVIRLLHSALGAYTAVLIYRLAHRSMDETTARLAAIFCTLHPVLICYAGISLKEVLMTCLLVVFIDMADRLLAGKKFTLATVVPVVAVGMSLFFFRTVLGMVAFMAVFFAIVMMDSKVVSVGRKVIVGSVLTILLMFVASDRIMREINEITSSDVMGQQRISMTRRYGTEGGKKSGNSFAKYAGATVFAPLIFTIPFPTMVYVEDQEDMRLIHGGNWVRNIMSGFVILAMVMLLLSGDWRQYTLPLAMLLGYLVMLVFTQFAHSLRFHIPVMPFEMLFAAYAITHMRNKQKRWYTYWCVFMIVTCVAWNWFKLAGRGLA